MKLLELASRFDAAWSALRGRTPDVRGAYAGALFTRLNADWITSPLPSDRELITDLRTLRTRSRDLGRNNPFGVRFLELVQENVVGPVGIDSQPVLLGPDGERDRTMNRLLHDAWLRWTDSVSLDERFAMPDFCQLGASNVAQDGELFVRMHVGRQYRHGLALQFVDADLCDEAYNMPRDRQRGRNEIRLSVEVDERARRVGYHFYEDPYVYGERGGQRYFVPADEILHVGRARRVNQTRYVPWFAPVMDAMRMLDGLVEAELVASRAAAAKMGWLVNKESRQLGEKRADGTRTPVPMEATPGSIAVAPTGYEFQPWDPQHPTTAFASFHASMIRRIAAGLCISYTHLANDPGDANYSSARTALQMEQRFWRKIQQVWVRQFMQPVFDAWLRTAMLTGDVQLPYGVTYEKARRVKWEVPGWEWIDPLNDVQAAKLAIESNLDSEQRVAALRGLDYEEDVIAPRREAKRMIEAAGLTPVPPTGGAPPNADTPPARTNAGSADSGPGAPPAPSRNGSDSRLPAGA